MTLVYSFKLDSKCNEQIYGDIYHLKEDVL